MRQLKLRAWDKEDKVIGKVTFIDFEENEIGMYLEGNIYQFNTFDEVVLMQYTGIQDIHGREIYESDIVKITAKYDDEDGVDEWTSMGVVEWNEHWCGYGVNEGNDLWEELRKELYDKWELEIIGNIFENPELMEE